MKTCTHHEQNSSSSLSKKSLFHFFFKDILFVSTFSVILISMSLYYFLPMEFFFFQAAYDFSKSIFHLIHKVWWGLILSIFFVGLLSKVPKEFIILALGSKKGTTGILRALALGFVMDICSHGILLIGMKLYERGASLAQVMAFLIASPWNSFSLMVILISLMGWKIMLIFLLFSFVVAFFTGLLFDFFEKKGVLISSPHTSSVPEGFHFFSEALKRLKKTNLNFQFLKEVLIVGIFESKILLRWIFLGLILTGFISAFVDPKILEFYFGSSLLGITLTLIVTTIIEICSEGSAPIASELLSTAKAPGNAFVFLMGGVSTDYTEILVLKQTTGSWKVAFFLPLLSVPQIVIIGYLINTFY